MTFNTNGKVTHAGWRTVEQPKEAWKCPSCERANARYNKNCPDCYEPRPS